MGVNNQKKGSCTILCVNAISAIQFVWLNLHCTDIACDVHSNAVRITCNVFDRTSVNPALGGSKARFVNITYRYVYNKAYLKLKLISLKRVPFRRYSLFWQPVMSLAHAL